jgi:hypothetical protein
VLAPIKNRAIGLIECAVKTAVQAPPFPKGTLLDVSTGKLASMFLFIEGRNGNCGLDLPRNILRTHGHENYTPA